MGTNQRSQIVMDDDEIAVFIDRSRTATMATMGPNGVPHLVAMWYGVIDGKIWFETKARVEKTVNLRRDNRITVMIEDGLTYDTLRGVSIEGTGEIVEDPDAIWQVGVSVWERYNGPYTEEMKPLVEFMLHKRVVVRVDPIRIRSWDHTQARYGPDAVGRHDRRVPQRRARELGRRIRHALRIGSGREARYRHAGDEEGARRLVEVALRRAPEPAAVHLDVDAAAEQRLHELERELATAPELERLAAIGHLHQPVLHLELARHDPAPLMCGSVTSATASAVVISTRSRSSPGAGVRSSSSSSCTRKSRIIGVTGIAADPIRLSIWTISFVG